MKHNVLRLIIGSIAVIMFACGGKNNSTDKNKASLDSLPKEVRAISEKIMKDPNNAELYHERAKIFIDIKDVMSAQKDMQKVIALDTTKPAYFITLADLYFMMGKAGNSKAALEKCLSIAPKNTDATLKLSELYFLMQDYKKAVELTNKVLEEDKTNAKAYMLKGRSAKEVGDTLKAIDLFRNAIHYDQKYYDAYIQLGLIFAKKKSTLALDYYNNALNISPNSSEVYYNMGMFYQETGDLAKAIECYNAIIQINPKDKFAFFLKAANYNLGYIQLIYKKAPKQAVNYFATAAKIDTSYTDAWYMLGLCHEQLKNTKEAHENYKKVLSQQPDYENALKGLDRVDRMSLKK